MKVIHIPIKKLKRLALRLRTVIRHTKDFNAHAALTIFSVYHYVKELTKIHTKSEKRSEQPLMNSILDF